jgi:hypothetical protein
MDFPLGQSPATVLAPQKFGTAQTSCGGSLIGQAPTWHASKIPVLHRDQPNQ